MFTKPNEALAWDYIRQSRANLVDYLRTLTNSEWDRASLCSGWLVRDVVAHLLLEYHYTAKNSWKDFLQSGFKVNTFMRQTAVALGKKSPTALVEQFQVMIPEQHKPASVSIINILVDLLVHEQDIRVPLNHPKAMPSDMLRLVFSHWEPTGFNFGEKITGVTDRVNGLRFTATDIGISKGTGLRVEGNAQDILMALTGRTVTIANLRGDGVEVLKGRIVA